MGYTWDDLRRMAQENPDLARRNEYLLRQTTGATPESPRTHSERGSRNAKTGRRFEDDIDRVLAHYWAEGLGMVFPADARSRFVAPGRIVYEPQDPNGPPQNPPDFMGILFGIPVGFDAKVSRSSDTYYANRDKKRFQHSGILRLYDSYKGCGLFGYMVEWGDGKVSFNHANTCYDDGKVRKRDATLIADSVEELFREIRADIARECGKQ